MARRDGLRPLIRSERSVDTFRSGHRYVPNVSSIGSERISGRNHFDSGRRHFVNMYNAIDIDRAYFIRRKLNSPTHTIHYRAQIEADFDSRIRLLSTETSLALRLSISVSLKTDIHCKVIGSDNRDHPEQMQRRTCYERKR